MNAQMTDMDREFARVLGLLPRPQVPTTHTFCGQEFPRNPQDVARDMWVAEQLPVVVAALESRDASLAMGFEDVKWSPAILDAYRNNDAIEFLRLVQNAVRQELANDADLALEEEAFVRFPEEPL